MWQQRIDSLHAGGIESLADNIMERWFANDFRRHSALELLAWRNMLTRTPLQGYIGCCAAIAACDFEPGNARLALPTLVIAGEEDGSTPPKLVRATAAMIEGSRFELINNAAHLPCVEQPEVYASILGDFIREHGYA
jgi:3-oxoadipate enol-lactonase